jgi:hypothetical protein
MSGIVINAAMRRRIVEAACSHAFDIIKLAQKKGLSIEDTKILLNRNTVNTLKTYKKAYKIEDDGFEEFIQNELLELWIQNSHLGDHSSAVYDIILRIIMERYDDGSLVKDFKKHLQSEAKQGDAEGRRKRKKSTRKRKKSKRKRGRGKKSKRKRRGTKKRSRKRRR